MVKKSFLNNQHNNGERDGEELKKCNEKWQPIFEWYIVAFTGCMQIMMVLILIRTVSYITFGASLDWFAQ